MKYPDYYAKLGVAKDASPEDIKKAFRRLARKYHPDISKETDAAARMAELNEANEVLSDPHKRTVYDQVGHPAWAQGARSTQDAGPAPGWDQGFAQGSQAAAGRGGFGQGADHSEFFDELFGRAARERARQSASQSGNETSWRGDDQHADITIDLHEAYHGAQRTLRLQGLRLDASGRPVPEVRTLQVMIPVGVAEGQLIRLTGQGHPGFGAGASGDLFLKIHIHPDAAYRVAGRDVHMRVAVTPWEAALGGDITVRTPAGQITVVVPVGSVSGRKLRVRGKGIPGAQAGDLLLELDIAVPSAVSTEQTTAWQALAKAYPGFDPRPA